MPENELHSLVNDIKQARENRMQGLDAIFQSLRYRARWTLYNHRDRYRMVTANGQGQVRVTSGN